MWSGVRESETLTESTLAKRGFSDVMLADAERCGGSRAPNHRPVELERTRARKNQIDGGMATPGTLVESELRVRFAWSWRRVEAWKRGKAILRQSRWRTHWTLGSIWDSLPRLTGVCGYDDAAKH